MPCERIRAQLTPYLDGELDGDRGTLVRGHLRTCADCAHVAEQEAALRDGLRALPSVDPPATLWAGVQARLADEEVAESKRPAWRRLLGRWRRLVPATPRIAFGSVVLAAAVIAAYVKTRPAEEPQTLITNVTNLPPTKISPDHGGKTAPTKPGDCLGGAGDDVTADLAAEPAKIVACYTQAIDEIVAESKQISWGDDRRAKFDAKVSAMRDAIAKAAEGKPRRRAAEALLTYVEGAVIRRDDVMLASRGDL